MLLLKAYFQIAFYKCEISFFFHMKKELLCNLMKTVEFAFLYIAKWLALI